MKKLWLTALLALAVGLPANAEPLSLKQCIDYARRNNSTMKVAALSYKISDKMVKEQIGTSLPQIDASGSFTDNLKISTTMLPAIMFGGNAGDFIPVKMGMEYSMAGGVTLTQKLFDYSFWLALDASKLNKEITAQSTDKKDEAVSYNVIAAYYRVQVIQKQLDNIREMLTSSEKILNSTETKFKFGAAKKIDVDKIRVSYNNTKSRLDQTQLSLDQALNNLKFTMGMELTQNVSLSDSLTDSNVPDLNSISTNFDGVAQNRLDYQIQQTTLKARELDAQYKRSSYMPTLSLTANYNYVKQENELFDSKKDWYPSSALMLNLKVPIFSGFSREARVEQADLNAEIEKENLRNLEQSIQLELNNYYIQYRNSIENIQNEKDNLALAQSVFANTQEEFAQGRTSSLALVQAESSLRESQNNYYSKLLNLYIAQLDFEKSKGTLSQFINNIK